MEKLIIIIIIFLFSFVLNAQTRTFQSNEDWSFKPDKAKHTFVGSGSSALVFIHVNRKTNDIDLAVRAAWMSSALLALGKEMYDGVNGKEVSLADMTYTIGSGVLTAYLMKSITRYRHKIRLKKLKKRYGIEF